MLADSLKDVNKCNISMLSLKPSEIIYGMRLLTSTEHQKKEEIYVDTGTRQVPNLDVLLQCNLELFDAALKTDVKLNTLSDWWNKHNVLNDSHVSSIRWMFVAYSLKLLHFLYLTLRYDIADIGEMKNQEKDGNTCKNGEMNDKQEKDESKVRETNYRQEQDESEDKTDTYDKKEVVEKGNSKENKATDNPRSYIPTLGVQDQKVVKTILQFVVCLGICPCLQTGVGIPLQMRSGFSFFVESTKHTESLYSNHLCLFTCLKVLVQCTELSSLGTIILSQHLSDILAGLLQIVHVKTRKSGNRSINSEKSKSLDSVDEKLENERRKASEVESLPNSSEIEGMTEKTLWRGDEDIAGIDEATVEVEYCEKALLDLFNRVYPPLLVKTLLLLQGGPKVKKPSTSRVPMLPPAPMWLRRIINQQLSVIMMKPKGVQYVLRGMLDGPGATAGTAEWKRCDAVAKVIACCPLQSVSLEEYYNAIGPQIIDLLHLEDKQLCKQYMRIACSTISNMAQQNLDLTRQSVMIPILEPLLSCLADKDICNSGRMVPEKLLNTCIEDCHKVFVCGCTDNPKLIAVLQPVILSMFDLLVFMKPGISAIKNLCHEVVVSFLKQISNKLGTTCLDVMTFKHSAQEVQVDLPRMHPNLEFQYGPNGGVQIAVVTSHREAGMEEDDKSRIECIVAIMKELKNTGLSGEFFVHMLKELTFVIQTEVDSTNQTGLAGPKTDSEILLHEEICRKTRVEQFYKKLMLLNVLASVCEELGPDCIQNSSHALEFVEATLMRGVQVCRNTEEVLTEIFESETLSMAMGLLTATLTGAYQLTDENREFMNGLLPLLQEISENHPESSVQEMATDIRIAIATHGAVWSEKAKSRTKDFSKCAEEFSKGANTVKMNQTKIDKPVIKIEVLKEDLRTIKDSPGLGQTNSKFEQDINDITDKPKSKLEQETNVANVHQNLSSQQTISETIGKIKSQIRQESISTKAKTESEKDSKTTEKSRSEMKMESPQTVVHSKSELDQAYEELCDPLLPVRGHGLIRLTRMIQRKDLEVVKRPEAVLEIFLENLDHTDSYMYLAAVSGLTALSDLCPDLVVPKLCVQFANFDQIRDKKRPKRKVELRMKLGEVLVKASRCLGDTIPKYRDVLIQTFLVGTKDTEAFVRASSLSNIGEICKLLRFSLGGIIHEVFDCCSSLLRSDEDKEVRKAAGQAITLLLQGMSGDSFKVLEGVIRDLYRVLKQCMITEKEESVKVHATLALNEMDDIMRKQLFPTQKLEKRIRVLNFE